MAPRTNSEPSSVRSPPTLLTNGGFVVRAAKTGLVRSRRKNCPKPPLIAVFPFPKISHATPTRGAIFLKLFLRSDRFSNSVGTLAPGSPEQRLPAPFGTTNPLHESE